MLNRLTLHILMVFCFSTITLIPQKAVEIVSNEFITYNYYRLVVQLIELKGDTTLYIPTQYNQSKKISLSSADFYIKIKKATSSPEEFIFPIWVKVKTQQGERADDLLYRIKKSELPAVIDLVFPVAAASYAKMIKVLSDWSGVPITPKLTAAEKDVSALIENADKETMAGNYRESLSLYIRAVLLDHSKYTVLIPAIVRCQLHLGEEALSTAQYDEAYLYLSSAVEACDKDDLSQSELADRLLADCYKKLGERSYFKGNPGEALYYYEAGLKLTASDNEMSQRISTIKNEKHSSLTLGAFALFPGGAQFYKGEYAKAVTMFGIFSSALAIMNIKLEEARKSDDVALNYRQIAPTLGGTELAAARRLEFSAEQEAQRKRQIAYTALAASGVVVLWSVYDAIYTEDRKYHPKLTESNFKFALKTKPDSFGVQIGYEF